MNRNLTWKNILIIVLVIVAAWTLYPPKQTLKPGIDLAGGTSLIYKIDDYGLSEAEKKDLSAKMITILRRRIDPANIQNLVWRPQGNTRFEIQMPLASAEAREKRREYENQISLLLSENINPAVILRSLSKEKQQREKDFQKFTKNSPERAKILQTLAQTFDRLSQLQADRDKLASELDIPRNLVKIARLNSTAIESNLPKWAKMDPNQLNQALLDFLGSEDNLDMLTRYVNIYTRWAEVVEQLTEPQTGLNDRFRDAKSALDRLNLTREQLEYCLELDFDSAGRKDAIENIKQQFPDRIDKIEKTVAAYDSYYPFRGRLDDPADLQKMLVGAGILEFRVLPTSDRTELTADEIDTYTRKLKEKGPKYASDNNYIWCQIENIDEWKRGLEVIAPFGDKFYVLASNRKDEVMLHKIDGKDWKLKSAAPGRESQTGRRAINFVLDDRAGNTFATITGKNLTRPLCILLDGLAISAPTINSRITTRGQITGQFTQIEQSNLIDKLNAGSLPARLIEKPISVKTIGPSIGADNRDKGIKAGLVGFVAVALCMAVYYTLAGTIADVALLLNLLFVLAIMALIRANFTLPGIAGIILTIGMSVDANVLIFERIREEQKKGSSLRIAIKNGYQKAFRTIFDANLTTFITAGILLWVASEEIKGFAIVLMLGILSSMFTALFVTRANFDSLLSKRLLKDHLKMFRLIHNPNVNWMKARPVFLTVSALLITAGLAVFFTRNDAKNNKYDIEFTGGTSVVITLKDDVELSRQQVEDKIRQTATALNNPALAAANVYSIGKSGKQYEINTIETNRTTTILTLAQAGEHTVQTVTAAIENAQRPFAEKLTDLQVNPSDQSGSTFIVKTSQMNKSVVKNILAAAFDNAQISEPKLEDVVDKAIKMTFKDQLKVRRNLQPQITATEKITEQVITAYPELTDFLGGVKISCKLAKKVNFAEIDQRLRTLQIKSEVYNFKWQPYTILGPDLNAAEPNKPTDCFVYLSAESEAALVELTDHQWKQFVENETDKIKTALSRESSFLQTQFDPSIGKEAKTQALIAIVLSLFAIIAYIWVRFGDLRYGLAAIAALVHDVCITLGAVTACTYLAPTAFGKAILIGDFKINLAMVAAFLTLIGYSLNDTIVVFDRIRENRKRGPLRENIINDSINQTVSRTILTSFTTFIVILTMYIFGGTALRGFTFAIGFGIIIGTYSSIAIAAPILLIGSKKYTVR